jgi:hypothetical protein
MTRPSDSNNIAGLVMGACLVTLIICLTVIVIHVLDLIWA